MFGNSIVIPCPVIWNGPTQKSKAAKMSPTARPSSPAKSPIPSIKPLIMASPIFQANTISLGTPVPIIQAPMPRMRLRSLGMMSIAVWATHLMAAGTHSFRNVLASTGPFAISQSMMPESMALRLAQRPGNALIIQLTNSLAQARRFVAKAGASALIKSITFPPMSSRLLSTTSKLMD